MQNSINCSVETCKHNGMNKTCSLGNVTVGSTTISSPEAKRDTECGSFECSASR